MDDQIRFENSNITLLREPEPIRKLAELAGKIAYYNFKWRYVTLLMFSTVEALGVKTFMKFYGKSVFMKLGEFRPQHRFPVPQYVLFHENTSVIQHYLEWLVRAGYENWGKFIVVCVTPNRDACDERAVFKTCLNIVLIDVIFLRVGDVGTDPVGFTYWPVKTNLCYDNRPVKLDLQWDNNNASTYLKLFPDKLKNLHHCPVKVSTFEQHPFMYLRNESHPEGLDGELLLVLMNALNATFEIVRPADRSWGHYERHNWTGALGEVFNDRAHIAMCSAPLTYNKFANFQISTMYNSMDMIWVTALPSEKPAWEKLLNPLKPYVRISLFLMFIFIAVTNSALKTKLWSKVRKILNITPPKSNLLFNSWLIFLGAPIIKLPKNMTLLIAIYQYIWFCFVIRNVYQAYLIGSLKHPAYEAGPQRFEEILHSKSEFGGSVNLKEFYSEDRNVYNRWKGITLNETYKRLNAISLGESNFYIAWNREMMIEYMSYYNGTRPLWALPEKIVNSPTVIFLKKYSPLTRPIDQMLSRLSEGGFTERSYARFISSGRRYSARTAAAPEPLRPLHLAGPAAVLILGWFISIFFFFVEIWCDMYEKTKSTEFLNVETDTYAK